MTNILLSGISIFILLVIIGYLFTNLKNINFYNVSIFIFLASFWSIMAFMKKLTINENNYNLSPWKWSLIIASYQFTQVIFRLPIGKLSQKIVSRKIPILLSTITIMISLICLFASNMQLWSIILGMIVTGIFGATFGMQNQYWSENYNLKRVFMTIAIVGIIPSLGSLIGDFSKSLIKYYDFQSIKWVLLGLVLIILIIIIAYYFFPEHKDTIRIDNTYIKNLQIQKFKIKDVINFSFLIVSASFAFNMLTTKVSYQDAISVDDGQFSILLTIISIILGLFISIYLIRICKINMLSIISHIIMIVGILLGFIINYIEMDNTAQSKIWKFTYLILITIGFSIFQNTFIGTALHLDHKNQLLVLGIWLTIRSGSIGLGQFTGQIITRYNLFDPYIKFIAGLMIVLFSLAFLIYTNTKNLKFKSLYKVVHMYEHKSFKVVHQEIWK